MKNANPLPDEFYSKIEQLRGRLDSIRGYL